MRLFFVTFISLLVMTSTTFGQTSPEELRAREIGHQLRCVVCQNQSIEESDAQLAEDMRLVVREQVAAGATDQDIIAYMRNNYGDYVLLKPPVQANTYVLWFLPAALVLLGLLWFVTRTQRKMVVSSAETIMSSDDKALLENLLRDDT